MFNFKVESNLTSKVRYFPGSHATRLKHLSEIYITGRLWKFPSSLSSMLV